MILPIDQLTQDQRIWCAKLTINCVLSDANVRLAEVDFIRDLIGFIENPEARKTLMKALENETKFELDAVPRLAKDQLALIFIQLIHLVIADKTFSDGENKFLREVAEQFDFTEGYTKNSCAIAPMAWPGIRRKMNCCSMKTMRSKSWIWMPLWCRFFSFQKKSNNGMPGLSPMPL